MHFMKNTCKECRLLKPSWQIRRLFGLFLYFAFCASALRAESLAPDDSEKALLSPPDNTLAPLELPDPRAAGFSTRFISKANADLYKSSVIPEMYEWLRSGVLEMDAASRLAYQWRYDQKLSDKLAALGDNKLAKISAVWEGMNSFKLNFNLLSASPGKGGDLALSGEILRAYTHAIDPKDRTIQIFKELLRFSKPALLSELKILTYRFNGQEEDKFWIRSPAIKLTRELTGSNRSDPLLKSSFSLDDFLVWSGKAENVEAHLDKSVSALVPFAGLKQAELRQSSDGCWIVYGGSFVADSNESQTLWNFGGLKYPAAASWLPTQAVFVPRELERVELISLDPFALYGRQVLYIDKETALPVYKIVFDRAGRHWKTIIGVFGLASDRANTQFIPFNYLLIAIDVIRDTAHVMEYSEISYCPRLGNSIKLEDFDPRALGPVDNKMATSPGAKKAP